MPRKKAAQLDPGLLARKGEAAPAPQTAATMPHGTKDTTAITVRLDDDRYKRLVGYGSRFRPRKTNQQIMVEALDAYLRDVTD